MTSGGSAPLLGAVVFVLGCCQNDCGNALIFIGSGSVDVPKQVTGQDTEVDSGSVDVPKQVTGQDTEVGEIENRRERKCSPYKHIFSTALCSKLTN